jgi:hypothetical protein
VAIEGLRRIFDVSSIKKEREKNLSQKRKGPKKQLKEEKTENHKVDIKI